MKLLCFSGKHVKNDSIRTATAKPLKNISFDAGVTYEYSETIDSLFSETEATNTNINGSYDYSLIIKGNGAGGGVVLKAKIESISSNSKDNNNEKGVTTGYVLKDDDVLDAFSVDIAIDSTYKTPIFKVVAGQSSCPWEPGTAKREGVLLTSVDGPVRTDVPANEPAVYRFYWAISVPPMNQGLMPLKQVLRAILMAQKFPVMVHR